MSFLDLYKVAFLPNIDRSPNTLLLVLGNALSMSINLELTLKILGLLFFSGLLSVIILLTASMSIQSLLLVIIQLESSFITLGMDQMNF